MTITHTKKPDLEFLGWTGFNWSAVGRLIGLLIAPHKQASRQTAHSLKKEPPVNHNGQMDGFSWLLNTDFIKKESVLKS